MALPQASEELWLTVESMRRVLKRQERKLQKKLADLEGVAGASPKELDRRRNEFQAYRKESEALGARLREKDPELYEFCVRLRDEPSLFPLHCASGAAERLESRKQRLGEIVEKFKIEN